MEKRLWVETTGTAIRIRVISVVVLTAVGGGIREVAHKSVRALAPGHPECCFKAACDVFGGVTSPSGFASGRDETGKSGDVRVRNEVQSVKPPSPVTVIPICDKSRPEFDFKLVLGARHQFNALSMGLGNPRIH